MNTHVDEPIEDINTINVPDIELMWLHIPREGVVNAFGQALDYPSLITIFLDEFQLVLRQLKSGARFQKTLFGSSQTSGSIMFWRPQVLLSTEALDLWDAVVLAKRVAIQCMTWGDRETFERARRGPGNVFVPREGSLGSPPRDDTKCVDDGRFARLWSDPTVRRSSPAIRPDDILKTEAEIGHRLPESYIRFLLTHDSGPSFSLPDASFPSLGEDPFRVSDFYSIVTAEDEGRLYPGMRCGLAATYIEYRDEGMVPAWLLPIGDSGSGDLLCLELDGERRGGVAVWYHELYDYERNESMDDCIIPVAPTFEAFLDLLEPDRDS